MARRRFTVRDVAEILEHWQAERSIRAISRSFGVCRNTVRKYVYAAGAGDITRVTQRHLKAGRRF